jgi:CheY-like chemotaxis protein
VQSWLILLVDADRRVQKAFTRAASEQGLEVVTCDTARAGVNAACALEPTAIVTELELPDFDGHWLLAQLRDQPTDVAVTPIVVVTHEIDTSSRARTLDAGADVFLQKPIAATDLLAQVRALVEMSRRILERRRPSLIAAPPRPPVTFAAVPRSIPSDVAAALDPMAALDALEVSSVAPALAAPAAVVPRAAAAPTPPAGVPAAVAAPTPAAGVPAAVPAPGAATDEWADADEPITKPRPVLDAFALALDSAAALADVGAPPKPAAGRISQRPPSRASQRPPSRSTTQRPPPAKAGPTRPPARPSKPPKAAVLRLPPVKVPPARLPTLGPSADKPPLARPTAAVVPRAPIRMAGAAAPRLPAPAPTGIPLRPVAAGPTEGAAPPPAPPAAAAPTLTATPFAAAPAEGAAPPPTPPAGAAPPKPPAGAAPPKPPAAATPDARRRSAGAPRTPPPGADDEDIIEAENDG